MRDWLLAQGLRFTASALVRQLRLPRRLWHGQRRGFGLGRHPLLCLPRRRGAERSSDTVLTAPEGNAWLATACCARSANVSGARLLTGALAFRVAAGERTSGRPDRGRPVVADERRTLRLLAEQLIWAAPLFLVPQVFAGHPALKVAAGSYSYAPWLVANLTLSRFPGRPCRRPAGLGQRALR
jgi:hypothetical protein